MNTKKLPFKILTLSMLMFLGHVTMLCRGLNHIRTEDDAQQYAHQLSQEIEVELSKNAKARSAKEQFYKSLTLREKFFASYFSIFETLNPNTIIRKDSEIITDAVKPLCTELKNDLIEPQRELLIKAATAISSKFPCAQCKWLKPKSTMNSESTVQFNAILTV